MSPIVNTNTAANAALKYLNLNSTQESSRLQKLASGSRIVNATDDAAGAGLAIGTRLPSNTAPLSGSNSPAAPEAETGRLLNTSDTPQSTVQAQPARINADAAAQTQLSSPGVKSQARIASMTQANQMPQEVMQLLKG